MSRTSSRLDVENGERMTGQAEKEFRAFVAQCIIRWRGGYGTPGLLARHAAAVNEAYERGRGAVKKPTRKAKGKR